MRIRREEVNDYREVEDLTREAFWNVYQPGCVEHLIIHRLREDPCFIPELDYVIEEDGKIVAHIAYAKGQLEQSDGKFVDSVLFGPISVLPEYQKKGYGSKLIEYTLEKAKAFNIPAVVITGSPNYYHRFGFETAAKHHIYLDGIDSNNDFPFFMVKILNEDLAENLQGIHHDPKCYFVDEKEVEVFDKDFPPKVKLVLPGQLR